MLEYLKPFNFEKAQEEALKMREKIKFGEASNYNEAEKLADKESEILQIEKLKNFFEDPETNKLFGIVHWLSQKVPYFFMRRQRNPLAYSSPEEKIQKSASELFRRVFVENELGNIFSLSLEKLAEYNFSPEQIAFVGYFQIKAAEMLSICKNTDLGEMSQAGEFLKKNNPEMLTWGEAFLNNQMEEAKSTDKKIDEKSISLLHDEYGYQGKGEEPVVINGKAETADSYPIDCATSGGSLWMFIHQAKRYELDKLFFKNFFKKAIENQVVIEIGPNYQWIQEGAAARSLGAKKYIGIDIDKSLESWGMEHEVDFLKKEGDKTDNIFLLIDDPINFLSKIDDHSVTIISTNVFNEPMTKNKAYTEKLTGLIAKKSIFGIHSLAGPDFKGEHFCIHKDALVYGRNDYYFFNSQADKLREKAAPLLKQFKQTLYGEKIT